MSSEENGGAGRGSGGDGLMVTKQQVAKLIEEDMGLAMLYLQGKGLCLVPISVVSDISSATATATAASSFSLPLSSSAPPPMGISIRSPHAGFGASDAPSSPAVSALLAHFAIANVSAAAKESVVVSKA